MPDPPWLGRSPATQTLSPLIVHGRDILEWWIDHCHLRNVRCLALFDHNDVVNTLSREEAIVAGIEVDHLSNDNMRCLLCSYGKKHSHKAFLPTNPYLPFIEELDGYVFTDVRSFTGNEIKVYRDPQLPLEAIRITGDKGCVSRLFCRSGDRGIPTILGDDKEDSIDAHRMGHPQNEGFVVKRGSKQRHHEQAHYNYAADPGRWMELVRLFGMRHTLAPTPAGDVKPFLQEALTAAPDGNQYLFIIGYANSLIARGGLSDVGRDRLARFLEPVSFAYDPEVYLNEFQLLINELWHNGDAG